MSSPALRLLASLFFCATFFQAAWAAPTFEEKMHDVVVMETQYNAASKRSSAPIRIQHFEIPLSLLEVSQAEDLEPSLYSSMVFERDGIKYVRWLINPEDTQWKLEVAAFLKANRISAEPREFFEGYLTASRSLVIRNPETGEEFSAKVSTNKTGGLWQSKKWEPQWSNQARKASDYLAKRFRKFGVQKAVLLEDPLHFVIPKIKQAMIIRSWKVLKEPNVRLVPAISALNEIKGREIAKLNGSNDPAAFWNEHLNLPLAEALAELFASSGLNIQSAHGQQFLPLFDDDWRPLDRVAMRDAGDSFAFVPFMRNTARADFLQGWDLKGFQTGVEGGASQRLFVPIGLLHGNKAPTWLDEATYARWGDDFFERFDLRLSQLTGIPLEELQATKVTFHQGYFYKNYDFTTPAFNAYFERLRQRTRENPASPVYRFDGSPMVCSHLFSAA